MKKYINEKQLTVIIPFLNEGNEVENTLRSIRETAGNCVEILIINDCSTDGFDYYSVALRYDAIYHKNEERKGVAASRDLGVELSQTPYFLFLDGHMRFYQEGWPDRIVNELRKDERLLLCCQTKVLYYNEGEVIEDEERPSTFGTYIRMDGVGLLDPQWIVNKEDFDSLKEGFIPCVMGAAYASSKKYWLFIKGLTGLISYGSDEAYMSLKVWLSGGHCKLLEDIIVGHIYRKVAPYPIMSLHTTYNKMLIAETLLPAKYKKQIFQTFKQSNNKIYIEAYNLLNKNIDDIEKLKSYYKQIFVKDFVFILKMNHPKPVASLMDLEKEQLLKQIAYHILLNSSVLQELGLYEGKMACVLFLFHYYRYSGNTVFEEAAEHLLEDICGELSSLLLVNMENGYCGIAWGLCYLVNRGFIEGDINEIVEDIDKKIMERDPKWISDWSFDRGLAGVLFYVSTRLMHNSDIILFDPEYIERLSAKVKNILLLQEIEKYKDYDILLEYAGYLFDKKLQNELTLYDFVCVSVFSNKPIESLPLHLRNGSISMGLKIILDAEDF